MAFALDGGGRPIDASGQAVLNGTTLSITRKGGPDHHISIQFNLSGGGGPFVAQKVVFAQKNLSGDLDGSVNLTDRVCSGAVVTLKNRWIHHGPKRGGSGNEAPAWKYFIRVQQTSTGNVGWIDPDI